MSAKLTTESCIVKANLIHNNKYDYSKAVYTGDKSKVCIICPIHGEFMQTFGMRPDIKKAREDAGADVASTTVITPIGDYWMG